MAILEVSPSLADRLREIARREDRSVEALLESLLNEYHVLRHDEYTDDVADQDDDLPPSGSLARLAVTAQAAGIRSGLTDTAARSREILETTWADYLLRRMHDEDTV